MADIANKLNKESESLAGAFVEVSRWFIPEDAQ